MKKLPLVLLYAGLQVSTSLPALAVANPVRASSVRATPSATTPLAQKNTTSTLRSTSNLTVKNSAEVKEPVVDVAITSANNVDTERVGGIKKNKAVSYVAAKPVTAGGSVDSRIDALQEQVFQLQNELIRKSEEVAELNSALNDKIENLDKKFVKDDELKTKLDVFVADNLEDKFVKDTDLTDKVDDIVKTKNFIKESDLSGRVDNLIGGKGYLTVADKSTLLDKIATTKQELGADITSARAAVIASAKKDKEDLESAINKAKIDAIDAADNAARSKFVHIADLEGNMEDFIDSKRIVTDTTDLSEKFGVFLDKELGDSERGRFRHFAAKGELNNKVNELNNKFVEKDGLDSRIDGILSGKKVLTENTDLSEKFGNLLDRELSDSSNGRFRHFAAKGDIDTKISALDNKFVKTDGLDSKIDNALAGRNFLTDDEDLSEKFAGFLDKELSDSTKGRFRHFADKGELSDRISALDSKFVKGDAIDGIINSKGFLKYGDSDSETKIGNIIKGKGFLRNDDDFETIVAERGFLKDGSAFESIIKNRGFITGDEVDRKGFLKDDSNFESIIKGKGFLKYGDDDSETRLGNIIKGKGFIRNDDDFDTIAAGRGFLKDGTALERIIKGRGFITGDEIDSRGFLTDGSAFENLIKGHGFLKYGDSDSTTKIGDIVKGHGFITGKEVDGKGFLKDDDDFRGKIDTIIGGKGFLKDDSDFRGKIDDIIGKKGFLKDDDNFRGKIDTIIGGKGFLTDNDVEGKGFLRDNSDFRGKIDDIIGKKGFLTDDDNFRGKIDTIIGGKGFLTDNDVEGKGFLRDNSDFRGKIDDIIGKKGFLTDNDVEGKGFLKYGDTDSETKIGTIIGNKGFLKNGDVDTILDGKGFLTKDSDTIKGLASKDAITKEGFKTTFGSLLDDEINAQSNNKFSNFITPTTLETNLRKSTTLKGLLGTTSDLPSSSSDLGAILQNAVGSAVETSPAVQSKVSSALSGTFAAKTDVDNLQEDLGSVADTVTSMSTDLSNVGTSLDAIGHSANISSGSTLSGWSTRLKKIN